MDAQAPEVFSNPKIQEMLLRATQKVFMTMLNSEACFDRCVDYSDAGVQAEMQPLSSEEEVYASSVGFAGMANGVVLLYIEESLADILTGKMLGMTSEEVKAEGRDTITDVLGELANMTAGTFKNQLCDLGYNCVLTVPSILKGKNFTVQGKKESSTIRKFYHFTVDGRAFVVDLLLKWRD